MTPHKETRDWVCNLLPSEQITLLGQIFERYPASEQHTKCSQLMYELKKELERYEEARPMTKSELLIIKTAWDKYNSTCKVSRPTPQPANEKSTP